MIPHLKLLGTSPLKATKSTEQAIKNNYITAATPDDSVTETPSHVHSHSTLPASQDGDRNIGVCSGTSNGHSEQEKRIGGDNGGFMEERGIDGQGIKAEEHKEAIVEKEQEEGEKIEDAQALDVILI